MKKLYSFHWDCGRQGSVEGLFVAEQESLEEMIGHEVHFGEILGKHSEVYGSLDEGDVSVLSEDQEKIEWLVNLMGGNHISGYNPLAHIRIDCVECDDPIVEDGSWYDGWKNIDDDYYCEKCAKEKEIANE